MKKILISAGDYSADLHGESLVREMRKLDPSLFVTALGGVRLKGVVNEFLRDMVEMDISGFSQPVKQFFSLKKILQDVVFPRLESSATHRADERLPCGDSRRVDAVVLIDYYGFNIHIARKAREKNIPVFYFVSPQVWASRRWRIQKLKSCVTKMLVIFPFEEELYRQNGVPVEFVGHPLMDRIAAAAREELRSPSNGASRHTAGARPPDVWRTIRLGLMPGSRPKEVTRHLPLMLECAKQLKKQFPSTEMILFAVDNIPDEFYRSLVGQETVRMVRENGYRERLGLTLSLTASGTATLENALLGIPMVVIYQTSWLTYLIARLIIQVPHISMPNILSGKDLVPELVQDRANSRRMAETAARLIADPNLLAKMKEELVQLREKLGQPGAYSRAAQTILKSIP